MNFSNNKKASGADSKFFNARGKGENHELREELRSPNRDKKRDAVKKVIANMTVGKDVSGLFTDVINCIQTDSLELKKLVYLYVINYAKTMPDLALLAVNTFVKDANDPNPLIRALAIRTMGCVRVEKITEYLCEPLSRCLKDDDPYVRKTAAVCVAKLYDITPELVEDRGFVDSLRDMISDANPTVVSNAVASLSEIAESSGKDVMNVNAAVLQKLLAALNECTEWGQVFILDSLSKYNPADNREAEGIIERIIPRLQHANSAVVMSAVKSILHFLSDVTNQEFIRLTYKKLAPPLITLLNSEPEIQYVALRNINLVVLKHPKILEQEIKVFFCKYNDPIYVKMEKLEIIIRLASEKNVEQVLLEFKEYATEVDVDFVRRAVRAIGRCAIKLDKAAERCITVLLDLIQTKVNYVVQEAIVVIKDIFRKYPDRYEGIIAKLCENLESLDEPEAKASMIWIIGEYADRIEGAGDLLDSFLETFVDETATVQLQLLTAVVKLFLKQHEVAHEMVQKVLKLATEESDNPDLRDRGFIYWRLLSSDPEAARAVVLSEKPEITDDTVTMEPALLDGLISQIATLASIYHKPPESFVMKSISASTTVEDEEDGEGDGEQAGGGGGGDDYSAQAAAGNASSAAAGSKPKSGGGDLLDLLDDAPPVPTSKPPNVSSNTSSLLDVFGGPAPSSASSSSVQRAQWAADTASGITIRGAMVKLNGQITLDLEISNSSSTPTQQLAINFNKNIMGIAVGATTIQLPQPISNGSSATTSYVVNVNPAAGAGADPANINIQTAIKTPAGAVFYFVIPTSFDCLFVQAPAMDVPTYGAAWKSIPESEDATAIANDLPTVDIEAIKAKLASRDVSFILRRDVTTGDAFTSVFFLCRTLNNINLHVELKFKPNMNVSKITVKSTNKPLSEHCKLAIQKIITAR